jgi:hypothetical protein
VGNENLGATESELRDVPFSRRHYASRKSIVAVILAVLVILCTTACHFHVVVH